ncbi:MAG: hypothetical protein KatS3mg050_1005 [Litorilinea sp.]|nr:MAG: hypothetical protein KatS3mg050_1005 [Litorilinea sp.]
MFRKILIANRGEIAVRILRACQELAIPAVAVYSQADAQALHVRLAHEAVCIGPPAPTDSYLRGERLVEAALETGCDAIHPGYGFLAESASFAQMVQDAGLTFIGPPPQAIAQMGVKTQARALMQEAGVPVVPGYAGGTSDEDFARAAQRMGYPVMVKAAGGGGGIGLQVVEEPAALPEALATARQAAQQAFGDPTVFLEKYIAQGRHVEVQILADHHGNVIHLFERDCSVQRRHQKIVEEAPSPALDPPLREALGRAAVTAARAVGYVNAGTVEFLLDQDRRFYFLEMNTRLQVEHPVTELITGVDLVRAQIAIAAGQPLPVAQDQVRPRGHAMECRLYAEDPARGFLPVTGRIHRLVEPSGPGVRVDSGVAAGDEVTAHYDPLLAKLIVWAEDRELARRRMLWALGRYTLLGLTTNLAFLRAVVAHPTFQAGAATTAFVSQEMAGWQPGSHRLDVAALIAAALAEESSDADMDWVTDSGRQAMPDPWARPDGFRLGGGFWPPGATARGTTRGTAG